MKGFTNIKKIFSLLIVCVFAIVLASCEEKGPAKEYKDPSTFDAYADEVLLYFVEGDATTINSFFIHPENFGIEECDAVMYCPEEQTEEEYEAEYQELYELLTNYENYDYNALNFDQKMCYETIKYLAKYYTTEIEDINYFESSYFGSYMGTNVDFPVTLSSYNLRNKHDVENYFKYIDSAPKAFSAYIDAEYERTEAGYGFPNNVIHDIVDHAKNMIENSDSSEGDHFLVTSFNNMIDAVDFLTEEEKAAYKELNKEKIAGPFTECYEMIIERIPGLLGKATNEAGLCHYVGEEGDRIGTQYYQFMLNHVTGYDYTLKEYVNYIDQKVSYSFGKIQTAYSELQRANSVYFNNLFNFEFPEISVEDQIKYFETASEGLYPKLNNPYHVEVNYVDEAVEDHYSPAFYILSPVDGDETENIFLNRKHIYTEVEDPETGEVTEKLNSTYLFTTLAHEGYPGHMYQRLYMKEQEMSTIRLILRCLGTTESWSTYSEVVAYELYFADEEKYLPYTEDFFIYNMALSNAIYARCELGIHYEGWTLDRTHQYMSRYFNVTKNDVRQIYRQLVELPGNSMAYNFAFFKILDMRDYALEHGATLYDFHKMYLDCGNVPQQVIEEYIHNYYE